MGEEGNGYGPEGTSDTEAVFVEVNGTSRDLDGEVLRGGVFGQSRLQLEG